MDYERAVPGTAERIVRAFEQQGDLRRRVEMEACEQRGKIVDAQIFAMRASLIFTGALGVCASVVALVLVIRGHYVPAAALGATELGGGFVIWALRRRSGR